MKRTSELVGFAAVCLLVKRYHLTICASDAALQATLVYKDALRLRALAHY